MGTRSIIKIEGVGFAQVYVHWDGNPEHMLPWLEAFNTAFTNQRGNDPEYKFAQLLRFSGHPENIDKYKLDDSAFTGFGVVEYDAECEQEYTYILKADGTVEHQQTQDTYRLVWEIDIDADNPQQAAFMARQYQLDPNAQVGVFTVLSRSDDIAVRVDLDELNEES